MGKLAFQEQIVGNHCWGCGALNDNGLGLKSYWDEDESVSSYTPQPFHTAAAPHVVNGGILASLVLAGAAGLERRGAVFLAVIYAFGGSLMLLAAAGQFALALAVMVMVAALATAFLRPFVKRHTRFGNV